MNPTDNRSHRLPTSSEFAMGQTDGQKKRAEPEFKPIFVWANDGHCIGRATTPDQVAELDQKRTEYERDSR